MAAEPTLLADRIRALLLADWDPHGAERNPAAHGTYDGYLDPIRQLIEAGATEDQVIAFLHEREQETMCFPSLWSARITSKASPK